MSINSSKTRYYHACGALKVNLWEKYGALPTFMPDGKLYISFDYNCAHQYIYWNDDHLWDIIVKNVQEKLRLAQITNMEPLDLEVQISSILGNVIECKGTDIGDIARSLASYFPVSSKEFRKVILDTQKENPKESYLLSFFLDGETILPNSLPGDTYDYGVAVPLTGPEKSKSAVIIPLNHFNRVGSLYTQKVKEIPALKIESQGFFFSRQY